ncbi:MAG: DUF262 domain-containing protein [Kineosporiaceae bacterium]
MMSCGPVAATPGREGTWDVGFQVAQRTVGELLRDATTGALQLPDFQRRYQWDDDRITELLLTVVRGHPLGVLVMLEAGGEAVRFKPTPLAGVDPTTAGAARYLLLDGQQRVTSLVRSLTRDGVVETVDGRGRPVTRRYYVDIEAAADPDGDPRALVVSVPGDGVVRAAHAQRPAYEVATLDGQVGAGLMPVTALFSPEGAGTWLRRWAWAAGEEAVDGRFEVADRVVERVVTPALDYLVPAIVLDAGTSRESVATVFEKVNTGGLPLDVFELLTATFAADASYHREFGADFRLGDDWQLTQDVLDAHPVLGDVRRTDVLQAVTLLATAQARRDHAGPGRPPAVSARREDVLGLDLADYLRWAPALREALVWVAGFLADQRVPAAEYVPYRSQLVSLAVVRVLVGPTVDRPPVRERVSRWYWCGVFAELYAGAVETRLARDVEQVPAWALAPLTGDSPEPRNPDALTARLLPASRIATVQGRGSAVYRGLVVLLLRAGAVDWADGTPLTGEAFRQGQGDLRLVFGRAWCAARGIGSGRRDSIVNKVPMTARTAALWGSGAPSERLRELAERCGLSPDEVDARVATHGADPWALRTDDPEAFVAARLRALAGLVEGATGRPLRESGRAAPVGARLGAG